MGRVYRHDGCHILSQGCHGNKHVIVLLQYSRESAGVKAFETLTPQKVYRKQKRNRFKVQFYQQILLVVLGYTH